MRNSITGIFFAALTGNAVAGWTVIGENAEIAFYVDSDTIRRSGNTVKMWSLINYSAPQKLGKEKSFMSGVSLSEYDCGERKARVLQSTPFKGKMREGEALFTSNTVGEWSYPLPGSVSYAELEIACTKK